MSNLFVKYLQSYDIISIVDESERVVWNSLMVSYNSFFEDETYNRKIVNIIRSKTEALLNIMNKDDCLKFLSQTVLKNNIILDKTFITKFGE